MIDDSCKGIIVKLFENFCHNRYSILKNKNLDNIGMAFTIMVRCDNNGYENDGSTHHDEWERTKIKYLHYIILSNQRVYLCISDFSRMREIHPGNFINTSNHDSCWKTDGLRDIFQVQIDVYDECWKHVPDKHRIAPIAADIKTELSPYFSDFNLIQYVKVERMIDENDKNRYFDKLKSIKKIDFRITLL